MCAAIGVCKSVRRNRGRSAALEGGRHEDSSAANGSLGEAARKEDRPSPMRGTRLLRAYNPLFLFIYNIRGFFFTVFLAFFAVFLAFLTVHLAFLTVFLAFFTVIAARVKHFVYFVLYPRSSIGRV